MTTELVQREGDHVALFGGTTQERIAIASEVATHFSDVVKRQRMFKRIGANDHIQIEAWQTIGSLVGVYATEADGGVRQLEWPRLGLVGELPVLGPEPRRKDSPEHEQWKKEKQDLDLWQLLVDLHRAHDLGRAFGYKAAFVCTKDGQPVGWGEGRCTRTETNWVNSDDHALAAMAQTRGQSRALGGPLKWIVKLAGYEPTSAEDLDGVVGSVQDAAQIEQLEIELAAARKALTESNEARKDIPKWGPEAADKLVDEALDALVEVLDDEAAVKFMKTLHKKLGGMPEAVARSFKLLAWYQSQAAKGDDS